MTSSTPTVVSLLASATEIICALGCHENLIAVSHECDFPPEVVRRLPVVTAPKFACDGTSYEIDQRIKAILAESLTVYRVDPEKLRELKPDCIVTQLQCEVCAVSPRDVELALNGWLGKKPEVVSLLPNSLEHIFNDISAVASALQVPSRGGELVNNLRTSLNAISEKSRKTSLHPRVACIEWLDPLMAAGNWMPELIEMAGGKNLFGEAGSHSPWFDFKQLLCSDADIVLIFPCGFGIPRTLNEISLLTSKPDWKLLRAVNRKQVYVLDGNQYFNRPGPRLVESLEILAEIFHPETFNFGHEGQGWVRI